MYLDLHALCTRTHTHTHTHLITPLSLCSPATSTPTPQIKAKNPSFGVADIAKELGVAWKALSDKEKSKYEDQAKKDKERYEKEMAKYKK